MDRENILSASVPVVLDGREYVLRYRAYAFIRYAEELQRELFVDLREAHELFEGMQRSGDGARFGAAFSKVRDLIWAGLVDAQPSVTRDQVARMFGPSDLAGILPSVMHAFAKTSPVSDGAARPTAAAEVQASPRPNGHAFGQATESGSASESANSADSPSPS